MMSISCLLVLVAAILAVVSAVVGRVPIWIPVFLLCLAQLLTCWPLR